MISNLKEIFKSLSSANSNDEGQKKYNILIFHRSGFSYGSTEKLMRQVAKILSSKFNVFFAYSGPTDEQEKIVLDKLGIRTIFFDYKYKQVREPFGLIGMQPDLKEIIKNHHIHCIFTDVYAHYQFPINSVPASIPIILISPFGHYCSNGNVAKTYVSGKENYQRLLKRGIKTAELFFNPLENFLPEFLRKDPIGDVITFGRIGRGDDSIFDPIALTAFKKLEDEYQNRVKYIVVNPPPAWKKLSERLGVKNQELRDPITDPEILSKFYQEIDVLAHARKDGETVGIAIAEAMMAGNPILTHRSHFHNDHFDILDPSYSLWSEADDVQKYFENMKWMVEHKDQIREMGQLARKRALEVFGMDTQAPKIIETFTNACRRYYHKSFFGRLKGYILLTWENLKAMPFFLGKLLTYKFPSLYKKLRRLYYE